MDIWIVVKITLFCIGMAHFYMGKGAELNKRDYVMIGFLFLILSTQ